MVCCLREKSETAKEYQLHQPMRWPGVTPLRYFYKDKPECIEPKGLKRKTTSTMVRFENGNKVPL
jgi:hypothetical protein